MTQEDRNRFVAAYALLCRFYSKDVDPQIAEVWWKLAQGIDIEDFEWAAQRHMMSEKFMPAFSELRMGAKYRNFPSPEEAWNQVPKSDYDAGWLCRETAEALGACQDSIDRGDMVGARMAFLEAYKRAVERSAGRPAWWVSEAALGSPGARSLALLAVLEKHPDRNPGLLQITLDRMDELNGQRRSTGTELALVGRRDGK